MFIGLSGTDKRSQIVQRIASNKGIGRKMKLIDVVLDKEFVREWPNHKFILSPNNSLFNEKKPNKDLAINKAINLQVMNYKYSKNH